MRFGVMGIKVMYGVYSYGVWVVILDSILHLRTIELKTILHLRKKSKIYNQLP